MILFQGQKFVFPWTVKNKVFIEVCSDIYRNIYVKELLTF